MAEILKRKVHAELVAQIDLSLSVGGFFKTSPDNRSVAYVIREGKKVSMVVNGKAGEPYDGIGKGDPIFSQDGRRVAYTAGVDDKFCVVVDGEAGARFDSIITISGAGLIFDSPTQLHYLVFRSSDVCLVTESIE